MIDSVDDCSAADPRWMNVGADPSNGVAPSSWYLVVWLVTIAVKGQVQETGSNTDEFVETGWKAALNPSPWRQWTRWRVHVGVVFAC